MIFLLGFAWWQILILAVCVLGFCVAVIQEADGMAVFIFVVVGALLYGVFKIDIWSWFLLNYLSLLLYMVYYFLAGMGWSVFKWFRFVKKELKEYQATKVQFLKKYKVEGTGTVVPNEFLEKWKQEISYKHWPPSPGEHKADIVRWIIVWPVSVVWALLEDFFVWVGEKLYAMVSKIYKGISDRLFSDFRKEFDK